VRGIPRLSWPVWLIIVGLALAAPGVVSAARLVMLTGPSLRMLLAASQARPTFLLLLAMAAVGLLCAGSGVVAYVIVSSLSYQSARRGYGSVGTILACLITAVIVANLLTLPYALLVTAQGRGGQPMVLTPGELVLSVLALDGSFLGVVYVRIVRPRVLSWRQMGLDATHFLRRLRQGVGVGVIVIIGSLAVAQILQRFGIHQTQEEMFRGVLNASLPQFVGVFLAAAIIGPICEEIFFRGYIFTAACRTYGAGPALALSSILFALAHLNLAAFVPILLIGSIFAFVYWRTGSLVPSMVAHVMNNALFIIALYVSPR